MTDLASSGDVAIIDEEIISERLGVGESESEPKPQVWLRMRPILKRLAAAPRGLASKRTIARWMWRPGEDTETALSECEAACARLAACGYVAIAHDEATRSVGVAITLRGRHALRFVGAPKAREREELGHRSHASELAYAIAQHYGVETHAMLQTGVAGPAVVARARLCAALHARGWSADRIARYFGMRRDWVERGIARWPKLEASEGKRPAPVVTIGQFRKAKRINERTVVADGCPARQASGDRCGRPPITRAPGADNYCGMHHRFSGMRADTAKRRLVAPKAGR